eukprot:1328659-Amphidinium_carterae.1
MNWACRAPRRGVGSARELPNGAVHYLGGVCGEINISQGWLTSIPCLNLPHSSRTTLTLRT